MFIGYTMPINVAPRFLIATVAFTFADIEDGIGVIASVLIDVIHGVLSPR